MAIRAISAVPHSVLITPCGSGTALGGAVSFGKGSARGQGNASGIKNDIRYWGANVYGVWNTEYANVIGNVGYLQSKNKISHAGYKGNLTSRHSPSASC